MSVSLPNRIRNYKISETSPTDELLTLGRIYAEVGDHAAAFTDREHLTVAKQCATKLKKVLPELLERGAIASEDDLYEMAESNAYSGDLSAMTVDGLYRLYRMWPLRHKEKGAESCRRELFAYEDIIVRELMARKAADRSEQLKIDYCTLTYAGECENLSFDF